MNRVEFEARLNQLLDQRLPIEHDDALRRLAEGDEELRALRDSYIVLLSETARLQLPDAPADLASRVLAQVAAGRRRSSRARLLWGAGLVAASVLVAYSWWMTGSTGKLPTVDGRVADTNSTEIPTPEGDLEPSTEMAEAGAPLEDLTRDAADRYQSLADSTSRHVSKALSAVPRFRTADSTEGVSGVPGGLISLGRSTGGSVAALFQAIPIAEPDPNG